MELRELLLEYKNLTEKFIEVVENEKYELYGDELLNKREVLLSELKTMSFQKEELMEISKEINLMDLEEHASKVLNAEKNKIKEEILTLKNNHNAVKNYGNAFKNINFINKEV